MMKTKATTMAGLPFSLPLTRTTATSTPTTHLLVRAVLLFLIIIIIQDGAESGRHDVSAPIYSHLGLFAYF